MESSILIHNVTKQELVNLIADAVSEQMAIFGGSQTDENKTYLRRIEAAKILRISLPTLDKLSKEGKIKYLRIGGRILYKHEDIINASAIS